MNQVSTNLAGVLAVGRGEFQSFSLTIEPFKGRELHVTAMQGQEGLSELYAFDVWFTCADILDPSRAAGQPVQLRLSTGSGSLVVAGVVTQFDCDDPTPLGDFTYRVVIGPHFSLTQLSRQNQVYGTDSPVEVADIIRGKLTNSLSARSTSGGETTQMAFDLRITGDYPQRDHVAQFDESDFSFLSRTCEHHGVFYFFEHSDSADTIVFADSNVGFRPAAGGSSLPFRLTRGQADDASISSFRATAKPVTRTIFVRDYDEQQASTELLASKEVDANGFGAVVEYGPNFTSVSAGTRFAQVRAEEQGAQRIVYHGVSTAPGLRPGTFFTLKGHPNHALDGRYVVVSIAHTAGDTMTQKGPYQNRFEAIPFATPYRPRRKTPRPSVGGLFNATIDSAGQGQRSDLDASGRYRLRHIYDESRSPAGQASTLVPKAQPYAGKSDTGLHMPLLKDTGVVVGYVNGDPDRPIIVGAVPGSTTPSVATRTNQLINRLRTPSGGLLEFGDGPYAAVGGDSPYTRIVAQSAGKTDFPESSYIRLGGYLADEGSGANQLAPATPGATDAQPSSPRATIPTVATVTSSQIDTSKSELYDSSEDYQSASYESSKEKGTLTSDQLQGNTQSNKTNKIKLKTAWVPPSRLGVLMYSDHDLMVKALGAAYVSYGKGHGTVVLSGDAEYDVPAGQYSVNAQNGVTIQAGTPSQPADLNLIAYNYINQKAYGPLDEVTYGDSYKNVHGNSTEYFQGTSTKDIRGDATETFHGKKNTWVVDADSTGKLAASVSMFMGLTTSLSFALNLTLKLTGEINILIGAKQDVIIGYSGKTVLGQDESYIVSGLKTVLIDDTKVVTGIDFKDVTVDSKVCVAFLEKKGADLTKDEVKVGSDSLAVRLSNLVTKINSIDVKTSSLIVKQ